MVKDLGKIPIGFMRKLNGLMKCFLACCPSRADNKLQHILKHPGTSRHTQASCRGDEMLLHSLAGYEVDQQEYQAPLYLIFAEEQTQTIQPCYNVLPRSSFG